MLFRVTITALVPTLVVVGGGAVYLIARERHPAAAELGRLAFAVALLALMLVFAGRTVTVGG